jgi:D-beta-D-heptose 7-phosphate kinase/D-beta-D-heptose 1-phosphate adenosyltransferase
MCGPGRKVAETGAAGHFRAATVAGFIPATPATGRRYDAAEPGGKMNERHRQLTEHLAAFPSVRLLCLGDLMIDRYVYGDVSRISPEAPVPVVSVDRQLVTLGAVGNVARNVVALGGRVSVVSVVGADEPAQELRRLAAAEPALDLHLVEDPSRRTTVKTRYVARGRQLLRADHEDRTPVAPALAERLLEAFEAELARADVVLLSDYAKGTLVDAVVTGAIRAARAAGKPVFVDPKGRDFCRYAGASLVKPNAAELEGFTGIPCTDDDETVRSARRALELCDTEAILVTRSERGMTLVPADAEPYHVRERSREVFDVSGAGDTALAVFGLAAGAGASLRTATALANKACGIVVGKVATAVVHASELTESLQSAEFAHAATKVEPLEVALDKVARWRTQNATVGFTNGIFDLLHAGHVALLARAKEHCDRLVVGLNSDASTRRLRGEGRPVNNETARAIVLASLGSVDSVVVFDENTPLRLVEALQPDVLFKGADYREDEIVGADVVRARGGQVVLIELADWPSTSDTIRRIRG